ncbi:BrnA antitoxin family protein [Treponema sp. R80B11-R83G3]
MITSKKLNSKRIAEIMNFPITYDKDSPKLTAEQIARMKPANHEYWKVKPVKVSLSIKIDADIAAWLKQGGKGYQTRLNAILRQAMVQSPLKA